MIIIALVAMAGLSGDPVVDGYPPDLVDECREYWQIALAHKALMKRRGWSDEPGNQEIRDKFDLCVSVRKAEKEGLRRKMAAQEAEAAQTRQREAQEAAAAERKAAIWSNPEVLRVAFSGVLCHDAKVRSDALSEIRKEQKYARIGGGIVDKAKLYDLQEKLAEVDADADDTRSALKKIGQRSVPCSVPDVARFARCLHDKGDESCTPEINEVVDEMNVPIFWGE